MFFIQDESKKASCGVNKNSQGWHLQQQQWELQGDSSSPRINLELCSCSVSHSKCLSTAMLIIPALLTVSPAPSQKLSAAYISCHLDKHIVYCFGDAEENLPSRQAEKQQHLGISCQ